MAVKQPPSPVVNFHGSAVSPTAVALSWEPPVTGTPPYRYTVFYRMQSSKNWTTGTTTTGTSAKISSLHPATVYQFEIMARNI